MRKAGIMDVDINTFIEGTTPEWRVFGNWIKDTLYWNMKFSEFQNRVATAFAGFKNKVRTGDMEGLVRLDPGLGKEAILLDKELSDMINFRYGTLWRPTITMDPIGQALYHLNSFNLKLIQLLHQEATEMKLGRWGKTWREDFAKDPLKVLKDMATDDRGAFLRTLLYGTLLSVMLGIGIGKSGLLDVRIGESPIFKLLWHIITLNFKELGKDLQNLIPLRSAIRRIGRIQKEGMRGLLRTGKEKAKSRRF